MPRPSWPEYFMSIAHLASMRATCNRKHVGAVIASIDKQILSTGYNGAPRGMPDCDEVGHELSDGHCIRSIHAEANALAFAGRCAQGAELFVTVSPCYDCAKAIVQAGIYRVTYGQFYSSRYGKSEHVTDFLRSAGVEVVFFESPALTLFKNALTEIETASSSH